MIGQLLVWFYEPFVGALLLGTAYVTTFTAVCTGVIFVVNPEHYGKSYSTIIGLYNTGFTVVPLLIGVMRS